MLHSDITNLISQCLYNPETERGTRMGFKMFLWNDFVIFNLRRYCVWKCLLDSDWVFGFIVYLWQPLFILGIDSRMFSGAVRFVLNALLFAVQTSTVCVQRILKSASKVKRRYIDVVSTMRTTSLIFSLSVYCCDFRRYKQYHSCSWIVANSSCTETRQYIVEEMEGRCKKVPTPASLLKNMRHFIKLHNQFIDLFITYPYVQKLYPCTYRPTSILTRYIYPEKNLIKNKITAQIIHFLFVYRCEWVSGHGWWRFW